MSITSTSTLAQVYTANIPSTPSTSGWATLAKPTVGTTWTATVGLFGNDLTTFFKNCATVGTTICDPAKFTGYSGWAIGIEFTMTAALASAAQVGVCFEAVSTTPNCVLITGASSGLVGLDSFNGAAAVNGLGTASVPSSIATNTCGHLVPATGGGFSDTCWYGTMGAFSTLTQFVYRYQDKATTGTYYEVGTSDTVYTMQTLSATAIYTTNTVTFAGAAQLAAASLGLLSLHLW